METQDASGATADNKSNENAQENAATNAEQQQENNSAPNNNSNNGMWYFWLELVSMRHSIYSAKSIGLVSLSLLRYR